MPFHDGFNDRPAGPRRLPALQTVSAVSCFFNFNLRKFAPFSRKIEKGRTLLPAGNELILRPQN
jgi:hypothetical protein